MNTLFAVMLFSVWGFESPHHEAFLSQGSRHMDPTEEEVMGPNMNFQPVSTTMQCTINLTLQYMVIFTALGLCRTYLDFQGTPYSESKVEGALKGASETVFYAPMVCLMFVGFRMRVLQLSKGTGNPQDWVRYAMQSVAYSILVNTLLVLLIPMFTESKEAAKKPLYDEHGDLNPDANPFKDDTMKMVFTGIRYVTFFGLYVGFGAVITGVFLYEPPTGVWEGEIPPLSPAVSCTMQLSTAFFLVYFLHAASRTYTQFTKGAVNSEFENAMERAADTMAMAPMFCVLFLAARMRALQMDPVGGNPQKWAQNCFYASTYAISFQTCLGVAAYLLSYKQATKNSALPNTEEYDFKSDDKESGNYLHKILSFCRWVVMIAVYVCGFAIACSVFTIEHPNGAEHTPALSPTMQCVLNLTFQYFMIYLLLWVFYSLCEFGVLKKDAKDGEATFFHKANDAIQNAKATVQFAPMLSVLFVATRMRALQISDNKGAPQGWVQDGMYLASWSILVQCMMCLIMPFFVDKFVPDQLDGPAKQETDATPDAEKSTTSKVGAFVVSFIRYAALFALIGGVATVITGVFLITPETANGRGAIPLISDGTLGVNLAPSPPGVTDLPGGEAALKATGETVGSGVDIVNDGTSAVTSPVTDTVTDVVALQKKK